jgi:formylglycine-generating enzyme required for sulfatase activity
MPLTEGDVLDTLSDPAATGIEFHVDKIHIIVPSQNRGGPAMRRWFLSYASQDFALTQALKIGLQALEPDAQIFFAPESMRAGGFWLPQLAEEIANSTAFALVVGETGIGPWQVMEYFEALDRRVKEPDYPVILILSAKRPAPGLPFARQLHWVLTEDPTSNATIGQLIAAASGPATQPGELWRHTRPYRGLEAMTEANSDFFFGRGRETVEVINALALERGKLPVLLGNSGVGKSSLAQAGVLASLLRQAWPEHVKDAGPWPVVFDHSRHWCFLTLRPGTDPLKALVECFLDVWQFEAEYQRVNEQKGFVELLLGGDASLSDLIDATERRRGKLDLPQPPTFFLYVDQGEELYVRAEEQQRRRFSELLAQAVADPRLRVMMSMRSDFLGHLQNDKPLFKVRQQIDVLPLAEQELREVVNRPAQLVGARFETEKLIDIISKRTAEDAVKDVGALPLLSYTLDDMWTQMVRRGDGTLRAESFELGGVLVERANRFLAMHPGAEDALRRVLTLRLATVRDDGVPTRRRAAREEFSPEEWRLVGELADHPNRLLVTFTTESGGAYADVAHETIFRRWDKLREWIAAEREFLAWRSGLEASRRGWQATPDASKQDALLMGAALAQAQSWLARRAEDFPELDREFIGQSIERERMAKGRARRVQTLVYVLLLGVIGGLIGWINQGYIKEEMNWVFTMRPYRVANVDPYVLKPDAEQALGPKDIFQECAKDCPKMVVIPAGEFMMGSPPGEKGRHDDEGPQRPVTIAQPLAVSKFAVTFADWDACVRVGGCPQEGGGMDLGWGRGTRPVMHVNWHDAKQYVAWLSTMTGKPYRLLSEAEYEYAARAMAQTAYPWGDEIGKNNANCNGCISQWDNRQTAPVGSFAPNAFGLYDMVGNVYSWVENCYSPDYRDAPMEGSARTSENCNRGRVVRGGSYRDSPENLRLARRFWYVPDYRYGQLGFRVGRTLSGRAGGNTVSQGAH